MARVVVGLSGGVDSSVAAFLLQKQGHEVIGVFMRNWHDDSVIINDDCPWIDDSNDALLVAEKLNIPFQVIDFSKEYKQRIVDYMFREYESGRTPNPDILCNREIKFDVFLNVALELGADFVATGHYCRKDTIEKDSKQIHRLLTGADKNKNQSYFLCQISQEQLSKALFPIGELEKSEVRKIAKREDLITADKKDSQGLCFIGKVRLPDFLQQQLKSKQGNVIEIDKDFNQYQRVNSNYIESAEPFNYVESDGEYKGHHIGAHFFTIGQRKGLGIGGTKEPLFIIATDVKTNTVYVGQNDQHPGLYRDALKMNPKEVSWIRPDLEINEGSSLDVLAQIRYRQNLVKATLHRKSEWYYLEFKTPMRGISPGQFAAWFIKDELIGSGVISI